MGASQVLLLEDSRAEKLIEGVPETKFESSNLLLTNIPQEMNKLHIECLLQFKATTVSEVVNGQCTVKLPPLPSKGIKVASCTMHGNTD